MKKVRSMIIVLIGLLLIISSVGVSAAEANDHGIKELISVKKQNIMNMHEQIDRVMQKEMKLEKPDPKTGTGVSKGINQIISYDLENAFIMYTIGGMNPAKESGSFESSFKDSIIWWKIPAKNRAGGTSLVSLRNNDGEFKWSGTTYGEGAEALIIDYQKLEDAVCKSEEIKEQIIEMRFVQAPIYSTCYVYLRTENNEYLVPYYFVERFNELELVKYQVYQASELVDMYYDYYDETKYADATELMYGGVPIREKTSSTIVYCCIAVGMIAVILTIIIILKRKKQERTI